MKCTYFLFASLLVITTLFSTPSKAAWQAEISAAKVNLAPIADAGLDQSVNEQSEVTLSGSGTDSDGNVVRYKWAQIAGSSVSLSRTGFWSSTWTRFETPASTAAQTFTFQLTVTDNNGATSTDTVDVTINSGVNTAPTANAGPDQSVNVQTVVTLSGSGTDSDGSVVRYKWAQIAGRSVSLSRTDFWSSAWTIFEAPASTTPLTLSFQLTVIDNDGATITDNVDITINPAASQTLTVTGQNNGNNFVVSWNNVGADSYRVLFWDNDGNVYEPTTASLSLSITSAIRRLVGSLVVEAYDARGNSVFSSPINVEAL
jgi:hypothetical protein